MKKTLCVVLLCGVFSAPAFAGDVQLAFKGPSDDQPVSIWYRDVQPGQLPGLVALGTDGSEWIVHVTMTVDQLDGAPEPQLIFDATIRKFEADKKGRLRMATVSRPRVITRAGVPASITTGTQGQELSLEMVYVEESPDPLPLDAPELDEADTGVPAEE